MTEKRKPGRKPTGKTVLFKNVTISAYPEQIQAIKDLARKKGKSLSRLVIETLLTQPEVSLAKPIKTPAGEV